LDRRLFSHPPLFFFKLHIYNQLDDWRVSAGAPGMGAAVIIVIASTHALCATSGVIEEKSF
jgi:hypothetical protein